MTRPISPGCRAMLVNCQNPVNNGIVVTVGRFLGEVPGWEGNQRWQIDKVVHGTVPGTSGFHADECRLRRLDDYDGNKPISWEDMRGLWHPKLVARDHA